MIFVENCVGIWEVLRQESSASFRPVPLVVVRVVGGFSFCRTTRSLGSASELPGRASYNGEEKPDLGWGDRWDDQARDRMELYSCKLMCSECERT